MTTCIECGRPIHVAQDYCDGPCLADQRACHDDHDDEEG